MILCCKIQTPGAVLEDLAELLAGLLAVLPDVGLPVGHDAVLPGAVLPVGHNAVLPGAILPGVVLPAAGLHSIEQQTECGETEICGRLH